MVDALVAAADVQVGNPIHKLVLLALAMSHGMPGVPIRVTDRIVARTELSSEEFTDALWQLVRGEFLTVRVTRGSFMVWLPV